MQLAAIVIPSFQKMQREGESGRRKINQWTRYLTVIVLILQGSAYLVNLNVQLRSAGASMPTDWWFRISSTIIMAGGSMFVLWLGERITDKGIGNGISFIILIGIIARLPHSLFEEFTSRVTEKSGGLVMFLFEILFYEECLMFCEIRLMGEINLKLNILILFIKKLQNLVI